MKMVWSSRVVRTLAIGALGMGCSDRPGEPPPSLVAPAEPLKLEARGRTLDQAVRAASADRLREALGPKLDRSRDGLTLERTAAGSRRIDLKGRFRSAHVLTVDDTGQKHVDCVTTKGELEQVLARGGRR